MQRTLLALVFFSCLVVGTTSSKASEEANAKAAHFKHPLTDMPAPAEDIYTSFFFPSHADQKFPIGETVTVLCHFSNEGSYPVNVTAIMGSLNFPDNFQFHQQNFSYKPFGFMVKPGEETTLQYQIMLHPGKRCGLDILPP
jgi:hypothetical protein